MISQVEKRRISLRSQMIVVWLFLVAIICGGMVVHAEEDSRKAEDIIRICKVTASSRNTAYSDLWNDKYSGVFAAQGEGEQFISVDLQGNEAAAIYIRWARNPSPWKLEVTLSDGNIISSEQGRFGYLQEYVELPNGSASFRIVTSDGSKQPLRMVELEVYSPGKLPSSVHKWQPTPSTAEIMMIATHQDDEILYFGGAIPYYAGELAYNTVIAYTAYDKDLRLHEALEGLWTCGARQHPVFFGYPDKYSMTLNAARETWSEQKVTRDITGLLVRYRPQVVISQDINGEYGHGQHLLTVRCVQNALKNAENADYVAEQFPDYRPWSVSKCYLHLYWKNRITIHWEDIRLDSAGGKTALEVARKAYKCHASQQKFNYVVGITADTFDCRKFGLYRTTVGEDINRNDFLENITLRYKNAEPGGEIPGWLQPTELRGRHYRVTDDRWLYSRYLRYCTVNGTEGWYEADETGCLKEPFSRVELVLDDTTLDLTRYGTLTKVNDTPPVYSYDYGVLIRDMPVRYCAVADGDTGFYVVDGKDGWLERPERPVHVYAQQMDELTLPRLTLSTEKRGVDSGKLAIAAVCFLLVITAFALSISVIRLNAASKRRAKSARRAYPARRNRRY